MSLLNLAPKPIARHLVVSAKDISPTPNSSIQAVSDSARTYQNPPRQSYPKELLKHRFMPYGSLIGNDDSGATQDVDVDMEADGEKGTTAQEGASPEKKPKELKGKKRKVEGDTPKKSKKAKTVV